MGSVGGSYPKRNWKKWNIYAGNFASDADAVRDSEGWALVDERTDESLPATNKQKVYFDFNQADGAPVYDLLGRRVGGKHTLSKGIYISKNKKTIK